MRAAVTSTEIGTTNQRCRHDGIGKSTVARAIAERLARPENARLNVIHLRLPDRPPDRSSHFATAPASHAESP